jgi:hypothetical protein
MVKVHCSEDKALGNEKDSTLGEKLRRYCTAID